ncbi:MAG: cyclic nucleotide-binding domain-containing protein [Gammaproteobacteria bacterium]
MADDKQKYAQQIGRFIPINELTQQALTEIINKAELLKIRKGGFVFKQGDRDELSYYLVEGEVELHSNNQVQSTITGGTERSSYAMAQLQPRQFSAKATKPSVVMKIKRDYLDKMLVLHEKEGTDGTITNYDLAKVSVEVSEVQVDEQVDWMTRMLQSELFSRMPTANIHAMFALLEPVEYKVGDVVIKQGDPGQDYFIIQEGHCQVLRSPPSGGRDIKLADLRAGDSFGEEALITDTTRNATVAMVSNGILMRLSKDNFIELIKKPTLQAVSYDQATKMVKEGAQWLDVRFKNEHDQAAIEGSINIPINVLRMQVEKLEPSKQYVVYCDTGGRSSTGAFLLTERGYKVCYLQGGLMNNPKAAKSTETVAPPPAKEAPAAPPAAREVKPAPKPAPKPAEVKPPPAKPAPESVDDLDPDVKASLLETELARTNMQLKEMEKRRQEMKDMGQKEVQAEVERRLQEERAKIEVAKKQAEEESKRLRQVEEEKLKRMKAEAEKRFQEEKKKIEEVYSRNAEEMEKLQRMRQEAEEKMKQDRERLDREAEQAKKQLEEANQIKKQVEASKRAMEKDAEKRRKEQEEMERKIQMKAREKLEEERKKLAEQFARNNEDLERAKQERAAAEASRQAAREEAAQIIEEFKAKSAEARAAEEARLQAERMKLEEEQRKIRETMLQIERARQDAEQVKLAAAQEVERLRIRQQDVEITHSRVAQASLSDEIRMAEEKLSQANRSIVQADEDHDRAAHARKMNAEDIAQKNALQEELRKQLASDLKGFKKELDAEEQKFVNLKSQMDHMRRIKQKADEAKLATQQATSSLLSDVASQLGQRGE